MENDLRGYIALAAVTALIRVLRRTGALPFDDLLAEVKMAAVGNVLTGRPEDARALESYLDSLRQMKDE